MDISASLWPIGVAVQLGDWIYEIPALPAPDWIAAIADPDGGAIVPGLLDPADQRLVHRDFIMGRIERDEFSRAWREVIGVVCGRPWWEAARLVLSATAAENWPVVHGKLVQRLDLETASIGGFCNTVYVMALEACKDEQERSKFLFDLTTAPPEVSPDEALAATDSAADFLAAMSQFQALGG